LCINSTTWNNNQNSGTTSKTRFSGGETKIENNHVWDIKTLCSEGNNFENNIHIKLEPYNNSFLQTKKARHFFSYETCFTLKEHVKSQVVHKVPSHNFKVRGQYSECAQNSTAFCYSKE
jgi:hypothetical protein